MKIALVTTLFSATEQRLALADLALAHHARVRVDGVTFVLCAAYTRFDDGALCEKHGYHRVWHDNDDLSGKHNAVYKMAGDLGADGAIIFGSDDFLSQAYLGGLVGLVRRGHDIITTSDLWFFDLATGRCIKKACARTGAGRYVAGAYLAMCDWQPYPPGLRRHLDGGIEGTLDRLGATHTRMGPAGPILDVKCDYGIWPFEKFMASSHKVSARSVLSHFGEDVQRFLHGHVGAQQHRTYFEASTLGEMEKAVAALRALYPPETPIGFADDDHLTFLAMRACSVRPDMKVVDEGDPAILVY